MKLKSTNSLFLNFFIRQFSLGMYSLFGPLFVASLFGFSSKGLLISALFYMTQRIILIVFTVPAGKIVEKLGFRRSMFLSTVFLALHYLCLYFSQHNTLFLIIAAAFGGLLVSLYWIPYHLIVSEDSEDALFGKEVTSLLLISRFAEILSPALGGLIIVKFGYTVLFSFSIIMIIISFLPLAFMEHHTVHKSFSFSEIILGIGSSKRRLQWLSFFSAGVHDTVENFIWVFVMIGILNGVAILGFVRSFSMVLMSIAVYITGKYIDRTKRAGDVLVASSRADAFFWIGRFFIETTRVLLIGEFIIRILSGILWSPFDAITYHRARNSEQGAFFFILRREVVINAGRVFALLLAIMFILLEINLKYGVFVGAVAAFSLALPKSKWWTRGE